MSSEWLFITKQNLKKDECNKRFLMKRWRELPTMTFDTNHSIFFHCYNFYIAKYQYIFLAFQPCQLLPKRVMFTLNCTPLFEIIIYFTSEMAKVESTEKGFRMNDSVLCCLHTSQNCLLATTAYLTVSMGNFFKSKPSNESTLGCSIILKM